MAGAFDACGALAPAAVLLEGDTARMWYLAADDCMGSCPSRNHASCGCTAQLSIGYAEASLPLYTP